MFENIDLLRRKFGPLQRNEVYYVDEDYFDRQQIEVKQGEISWIDLENRELILKGSNEKSGKENKLKFDKVLVAWGSQKNKLVKNYSNVHYLEDRQSHARCHNELLKAKKIVVFGSTLEAYQVAASAREYLDSIGYTSTQIVLL
jgi:NADH dehydrogenase FAD-containing subunit